MKKTHSDLILLDINVLLALAWPNHQFHASATRRLRIGQHWATCALTQLGFIRLSSNPAAIAGAVTPAEAASLLAQIVHDSYHVYLPMISAPAELVAPSAVFSDTANSRTSISFRSPTNTAPGC